MLQRVPCRNPLLRIVDENLAQQIQEKLVEGVGRRDRFLKTLHALDELLRLPRRVVCGIGEVAILEEARGAVTVAAFGAALHFTDEGFVDGVAGYGL